MIRGSIVVENNGKMEKSKILKDNRRLKQINKHKHKRKIQNKFIDHQTLRKRSSGLSVGRSFQFLQNHFSQFGQRFPDIVLQSRIEMSVGFLQLSQFVLLRNFRLRICLHFHFEQSKYYIGRIGSSRNSLEEQNMANENRDEQPMSKWPKT